MIVCFGIQRPNHLWKNIDDGWSPLIHQVLVFIFFWLWMVTSNPIVYYFLHLRQLLISNDDVQSNCVFNFLYVCILLLTEHVQASCARFVGPLIAASYMFICLCDNAKLWHTCLHSTILAVLLTQAPSLINTLLFEV